MTLRDLWRRTATVAVLLLSACAGEAGPESNAVGLVLANDGARPLRCVMVIAHFMSAELGTLPVGARRQFTLRRDPSDGSLFIHGGDRRRKTIENILCGADDDWSATRGDLPLQHLRSPEVGRVVFTCRIRDRLQCEMAERGNE